MRAPLLVRDGTGQRAVLRQERTPLSSDAVMLDGQAWWLEPYVSGMELDAFFAREVPREVVGALMVQLAQRLSTASGTRPVDGSAVRVDGAGQVWLLGDVGTAGAEALFEELHEAYPTRLGPPRSVAQWCAAGAAIEPLVAWAQAHSVDEAVVFESPRAGQVLGEAQSSAPTGPPPRVVVAGTAAVAMMVGIVGGRMLFDTSDTTQLVVEGATELVVSCEGFEVRATASRVVLPRNAGRCTVSATIGNDSHPSVAVRVNLQPTIHCIAREGDLQCSDN